LRPVRQHSKRRAAGIPASDISPSSAAFLQLKRSAASSRDSARARYLFAVLAAALAGVPLLITPGLSLYFDITPKVVLLLCAAAAALLLPRAWWAGLRLVGSDRAGRLFLFLLAAQLLSLLLSTVFSTEPALSFGGSNWRRFGLVPQAGVTLFVLVFASFLSAGRARLRPMLRLFALAGLAAALYGILQYCGIDPLQPSGSYHIGEGEWTIVRTPGTLGHAGYFATFLLTAVFWALALAQIESSRPWKALACAAAALASFAVVLSGTRGAILGLLAGAAIALLWRRPAINRRVLAGALLAACALGAFYVSPLGERLRARTRWYVEDPTGGGRLLLWRDSLRMFAAGPWWSGAGLETYSASFPPYLSRQLASAYPNRYYESPHNIFVDALTSQGLPGLLLLLAWTALAALAAWRLRKSRFPAGAWFAAAFVAALCSDQFLAFTLPTALCFYLSAAVLLALAVPEPQSPASVQVPRWAWPAAASAAILLATFAVQLAAADATLARVQRLAASGAIAAAVAQYQQARLLQPRGASVDLWFSRLMMAASQQAASPADRSQAWDAATQAGQRAAAHAPERQAACYNLALLYGQHNDAQQAEEALRRAIAVAPSWYKPHWMLAQLLRQTNRLREALREAEQAYELNAGANAEVTETREQLRANITANITNATPESAARKQ
jgi:O-antigen ligase